MNARRVFVGLCAALAIAASAQADVIPTYVATTASMTIDIYGIGAGTQLYSFSGPEVDLSGTAYFNWIAYYLLGPAPGVIFFYANISNFPSEGDSSGTIGGTLFLDAATKGFFTPPISTTFDGTDLSLTVPGRLTGTLTTCIPGATCNLTGIGQFFYVTSDIPGQWTLTIMKSPNINEYYLVSAQFTTVPEPGTAVLLVLGVGTAAAITHFRRRGI